MSELTIGPLGGPDAVQSAQSGQPAPAIGTGGQGQAERAVAGQNRFDRLELSAGSSMLQAYAQFTVHPQTGVVSIKIIDAATDEVIREIPPENVLRIAEELQAYLKVGQPRRP